MLEDLVTIRVKCHECGIYTTMQVPKQTATKYERGQWHPVYVLCSVCEDTHNNKIDVIDSLRGYTGI